MSNARLLAIVILATTAVACTIGPLPQANRDAVTDVAKEAGRESGASLDVGDAVASRLDSTVLISPDLGSGAQVESGAGTGGAGGMDAFTATGGAGGADAPFGTGGAIGTDGGTAAADARTATGDTPGADAPLDVPVGGSGGTGGTTATGGTAASAGTTIAGGTTTTGGTTATGGTTSGGGTSAMGGSTSTGGTGGTIAMGGTTSAGGTTSTGGSGTDTGTGTGTGIGTGVGFDASNDAPADSQMAGVVDASTGSGTGTGTGTTIDGAVAGLDAGADAQCPSGQALCGGGLDAGGTCLDVQSDPSNCGDCGRTCIAPMGGTVTCSSGQCVSACSGGLNLYGASPTWGGGGCAASGPTWQWVGGLSLATNAGVNQCWAAPGNEVYVSAGESLVTGEIPQTWLYHLKSGVWTQSLHLADAGVNLSPVFGTSASDVYAAVYACPNGFGNCGTGEGPVIWHFDGSNWSQMTIPNIGLNWITSMRGEVDNVYAAYGVGILRYDGTSWSVASTTGSVGYGPLAYLSQNEIYALGCWGYQAWNGTTWTNYPGFDFCDVNGAFGFRTGDGSLSLWAEGNNNDANGIRAWQFTENPEGSMTGSWGSKYGTYINDTSASGYGTGLGIWASGPNDFWVVGFVGNWGDPPDGRIWHWDGTNWTRQLASTSITAWAVSIWGTSPTDIWVALRDGRLLHYGN